MTTMTPAAGAGDLPFRLRHNASPLARRIARQAGFDLGLIRGSGPRGRVVEKDVRLAMAAVAPISSAKVATPAPIEAPAEPGRQAAADHIKAMFAPGSYEELPIDAMRRTIARRLVESKTTVPHFYLSMDCEVDALLALRQTLNAATGDGVPGRRLTINDFIIKALAAALQRIPAANAVWAEDCILRMKHADIGVAVALDGGLMTPIVRKAETKSLSAISAEVKDLAMRARQRRLGADEYAGGSTAISNLGMFGVRDFQAIINPPHGTILAVGAYAPRLVARNDGPGVVQAMTVTLSCDHRVVDGATGAELLEAFRRLIENPIAMLA